MNFVVANIFTLSQVCVHHGKINVDNVVNKFWLSGSFRFNNNLISILTLCPGRCSKTMAKAQVKIIHLHGTSQLLPFSGTGDSIFSVIMFLLFERLRDFTNIEKGRVENPDKLILRSLKFLHQNYIFPLQFGLRVSVALEESVRES